MIYATLDLETDLWNKGYKQVCGVDEVGRGCFAGPVVSAGVIFSPNCQLPKGIADSKLLSPKQRQKLAKEIKECALCYSIAEVSVEIINEVGIGKAAQQSFYQAVTTLSKNPDFILIDAFLIQGIDPLIQNAVIHGDRLSTSIAAASIIAKVYRDTLMENLDGEYPNFQFGKHKGYGTKAHRDAIKKYGLTDLHRKSFNLSKFLPD